MQELVRFLFLLFITLFLLFNLVQCRSIFSETIDEPQESLRNVDYMTLCFLRKGRLCDYLRDSSIEKADRTDGSPDVWKRGVSKFYSNW